MARIRTIKPEFWTDEKLSECSLSARLLFIGLWTFADDSGRMEHQPGRIRMQVFPCGSVSLEQVSEWLRELSERSLIRTYAVDGKEFLDIPGFAKHQRINRPTESKLPPFLSEHSLNGHGVLTPGTGKGKGTGDMSAPRETKPKGSRFCPDDFEPNDILLEWAALEYPHVDVKEQTKRFKDYEFSRPRSDWNRAWREWIRKSSDWSRAKPGARRDEGFVC